MPAGAATGIVVSNADALYWAEVCRLDFECVFAPPFKARFSPLQGQALAVLRGPEEHHRDAGVCPGALYIGGPGRHNVFTRTLVIIALLRHRAPCLACPRRAVGDILWERDELPLWRLKDKVLHLGPCRRRA